jgi:hypothetical protein
MARVKQQGIHSKGDSGRVVGMDQVNDAEGQDCGQNGHKGPTRKQAEQRSPGGSDNRTWNQSIGLRDRAWGRSIRMVSVAPKGGIRYSPIWLFSKPARTPNIDKIHKYSAMFNRDLVPHERTIRKQALRIDCSIHSKMRTLRCWSFGD